MTTIEIDLMSPGRVARKFGVTTETLKRWATDGALDIEMYTSGGHARYHPDEVKRLWDAIAERSRGSKNATESGTHSGMIRRSGTSAAKVWTPATTSKGQPDLPSSSSEVSTSPEPAPTFLD